MAAWQQSCRIVAAASGSNWHRAMRRDHLIVPGQDWDHRRDGRTVRVQATRDTRHGLISVINIATGRVSSLRAATLTGHYTLVEPDGE